MRKIISWVLIVLGSVGLVKGIIVLMQYGKVNSELAKEGIYFGLLPSEAVIFFFSIPILIIGIFLIIKKKRKL